MALPSTTNQASMSSFPFVEGQEQPDEEKKNSRFLARLNKGISKISGPMNRAAMEAGCEPFSPQNLDFEFDKAARILQSFCIDGFYTSGKSQDASQDASSSRDMHQSQKQKTTKVLRKIPPEVIRNCKGIAVFTTMRMGWQISGAGGCGIIMAKMPNGEWSPPSGILIHTVGWGLVAGLDVYDCVAVINSDKGMEGFTRLRGTVGAEVSAAAGPFGAGQTLDSELVKRQAPVWTYMKSRGLYVGAQIDGTIIIERTEENPRFYGKEGVRATQILNGEVEVPPGTATNLYETLHAIEGRPYRLEPLPPPYPMASRGPSAEQAQAEAEAWERKETI